MLTDLLIIDILIYSLCQSNSDGRHGCVHNIYYENRFDVYDSTTIIMLSEIASDEQLETCISG